MRDVVQFLRDNPQALVLLIICIVLGLGTFLAVVIAIAGSGSTTPSGEPTDVIFGLHVLLS
jgi:hypothetical protein